MGDENHKKGFSGLQVFGAGLASFLALAAVTNWLNFKSVKDISEDLMTEGGDYTGQHVTAKSYGDCEAQAKQFTLESDNGDLNHTFVTACYNEERTKVIGTVSCQNNKENPQEPVCENFTLNG